MYIKEMLSEDVIHVKQEKLNKLIKENQSLTKKKERASKLIAELKKENQQLKDTILLMDENAKSRNEFWLKKLGEKK